MTVKCKILDDFRAKKPVGNSVMYKVYRRNQIVNGSPIDISMTPHQQLMAIQTSDGYIIPETILNILPKKQAPKYDDAQIIEEPKLTMFKKASKIKYFNADRTFKENEQDNKKIINSGIGGIAIGVLYAMIRGKNKIVLGALGGVLGSSLGKVYVNLK